MSKMYATYLEELDAIRTDPKRTCRYSRCEVRLGTHDGLYCSLACSWLARRFGEEAREPSVHFADGKGGRLELPEWYKPARLHCVEPGWWRVDLVGWRGGFGGGSGPFRDKRSACEFAVRTLLWRIINFEEATNEHETARGIH